MGTLTKRQANKTRKAFLQRKGVIVKKTRKPDFESLVNPTLLDDMLAATK